MGDASDVLILTAVVLGRLLLPLLIFRYPLPAILGALVLDGLDQTIFEQFTTLDLSGYQSFDKALDIYYLSLAYLAMMRNWRSTGAFTLNRILFYYRFAGVAIFELTDAQHRFLLFLFPNTFEFFFIFYELARTRWDPHVQSTRFWLLAAAGIWVLIKLPQEYWIHVAQLDTTDLIADHPIVGVAMAAVLLALAAALWFGVRPGLRSPDHDFRLAADPVPEQMRRAPQRQAAILARGRLLNITLLEKFVLVGLICVIFASMLPHVQASPAQVALSVGVLVVLNATLGLWQAGRGRGYDNLVAGFASLAVVNAGLVVLVGLLRPGGARLGIGTTLFFILLLTLIVTLYDWYHPVHQTLTSQDRPHPETLIS